MQSRLSYGVIFRFWAPLSATWLMMAAEGPILAAIIARLPAPEINLAAYGVSANIAMLVESPIIMILIVSISLARDEDSFVKIRRFTNVLNIILTLAMLLLLLPPIFNAVSVNLMQLPPDVAELTYLGLALMVFWPASIGYRRFYQGILIRNGQTKIVALGTIVRLAMMSATGLVLAQVFHTSGIAVGAGGLAAGVLFESLAIRLLARKAVAVTCNRKPENRKLSYKEIAWFYYPLALTSLIGMSAGTLLTFLIGKSRMPIESWAALPVVDSLVFLFRSFGFSYQEVGIALLGERLRNYRELRSFGLIIGTASTVALGILAFTPLGDLAYQYLYGLTPELARFAIPPTQILVMLPFLSALYSIQRSAIIVAKKNAEVTISTLIEAVGIFLPFAAMIWLWNPTGIIAAAAAMLIGRLLAAGYLFRPYNLSLREATIRHKTM
ncbi:hypothetical protein MASR2M18_20970 [Ignavibacteria bacterium]|jgi:Na+-driven multidrug efflux pump|nr:hypothetical protein [Bacteroidota bacterium]MCZ2131989.1 hypothetical protein [Bacteroidota bacterium]